MSAKRHPRHYQTTLEILSKYPPDTPFSLFLTQTFRQHKNWGSKDRKAYRELSYLYWKNIQKFKNLDTVARISLLTAIDQGEEPTELNPYSNLSDSISPKIDQNKLATWFHPTPPVFFYPWDVHTDLSALGGKRTAEGSWVFQNSIDLGSLVDAGKGIIQDISSTQVVQKYGNLLKGKRVWDCCSGSGGKSLLMRAILKPSQLHCSDIRPQTIQNLLARFKTNHLTPPFTSVLDLSKSSEALKAIDAEIAFADVPCSGSGTWRRNPEILAQFDSDKIKVYTQKQKAILQSIASRKNIRQIIYCTCSLFQEENENQIALFLEKNPDFSCIEQHYHGSTAFEWRGDYLFSALLERKSF